MRICTWKHHSDISKPSLWVFLGEAHWFGSEWKWVMSISEQIRADKHRFQEESDEEKWKEKFSNIKDGRIIKWWWWWWGGVKHSRSDKDSTQWGNKHNNIRENWFNWHLFLLLLLLLCLPADERYKIKPLEPQLPKTSIKYMLQSFQMDINCKNHHKPFCHLHRGRLLLPVEKREKHLSWHNRNKKCSSNSFICALNYD